MIISTLAAMTAGYVLSVVFGTPEILRADRYLGMLCNWLEPKISGKYQDSGAGQRTAGTVYLILLLLMTLVPTILVLTLLYCFVPVLAIIVDAVLCWSVIDIRGISRTAAAVRRTVRSNILPKAAKNAENLSGTDCTDFDADNIVRASVQGIADRTVDSITAPLCYIFLLSGIGAIFWKTVDAAVRFTYREDKNGVYFTSSARKLRNALCFIPGKLAAVIMLVDALYLKQNTRAAERILKRDGKKCRQPAFGGCRAVLAGVLGISLLPEEVYSEQFMRTYTIGEQAGKPDAQNISLSVQLMHGTTFIIMILFFAVKLTIGVWF